MSNQKFKKPSKYITFASGWVRSNEDGSISKISCDSSYVNNAKSNKGDGYRLFVVPVDANGEQLSDSIEVTSFVVYPTNVDKDKYEKAPDYRLFFGVE